MYSFKKRYPKKLGLLITASAFLFWAPTHASAVALNGGAMMGTYGARSDVFLLEKTDTVVYSELVFSPGTDYDIGLTLNTMADFSAEMYREMGPYYQGAPRFYLGYDLDVTPGPEKYIAVHVSNPVNTSPTEDTWVSTGNLLSNGWQWENHQVGGSGSGTAVEAMALVGDEPIAIIGLVTDAAPVGDPLVTYWDNINIEAVQVEPQVPEPSTMTLALLGMLGLRLRRRRRKS